MILRIGIENGNEGRAIAWVLDYPGCFSYGQDEKEALHNLPTAIQEYNDLLAQHEQGLLTIPPDHKFHIAETWEVYSIDDNLELSSDGYEVNAWFLHDWKPITGTDIETGIELLTLCRADLLATVKDLDQESLEHKKTGEKWSIANILKHVGGAEWWYLDRLGMAFPREEVPSEPFERLEKVRARLLDSLPDLAGVSQVIGIDGEFWSPRKMLRRAIWHERDHTIHIRKLLPP
jgi:predicted RNase H-like HicB family nuclease